VLAGSCAEYDWTGDGVCVEGQTPLRPATLYGTCKDAARRVCEALAEQLGVGVAWGRVFFLYGPGEDERRLVAAVAKALTAGERAATSEGTQVRDFLHVDDVAGAFAALVDAEATGAVNIGAGEGVAIREVVEEIARAAGRPDLLDVGALPARPGDPPLLVPRVERLRSEVGYEPSTPLDAGLDDTVQWWRDLASKA
jgi:nucleoside-diphosphate-sugar epimerase